MAIVLVNQMFAKVRLMSLLVFFSLSISLLFINVSVFGQSLLIDPDGDGGFENGATFSTNGWTVVNDGTNYWMIGATTSNSGLNSAFVTNNSADNQYDISIDNTSHFYRDIAVPVDETDIELSFSLKGTGEQDYDRLLVYTAPVSVTPTAGNPVQWTENIPGATLVYTQPEVYSSYTDVNLMLDASFAGTTFRLIFTWQNDDNTGDNPPAAVDNISLISSHKQRFLTPGNYTFTVTSGMTDLSIEAWGGGGGGFNGDNKGGGHGGGGGGYAKHIIANPAPGDYTVVVGTGGTEGTNGTASTFGNNIVVADYGRGGTGRTTGGGTGGANNIGNVSTFIGGNGGDGNASGDLGGGGGGAAGFNGNGINGDNGESNVGGTGGDGDNGLGGFGGSGGNSNNGSDGQDHILGGGGGGGGDNHTTGGNGGYPGGGGGGGESGGGTGANGAVVITWSLCAPSDIPTLTATSTTICAGETTTLTIVLGNLNNADHWQWYSGSCAGTAVGQGTSITVSPTSTTTYYVRGEGNCDGSACAMVTVTVNEAIPDFSGDITNATCSSDNGGAIFIDPILDPAVEFDNADNDYIDLGSSFLSGLSSFTLEGWIKVNLNDISGTRVGSLFGQNDAIEFGFYDQNTIQCWTPNGGSVNVSSTSYPTDNDWHHVAVTGDGSSLIIYIDGTNVGTGGNATSNYGSSAYSAKIGGGIWDPTGGALNGSIKRVGFWNTALNSTQIAELAASSKGYTGSEPGLIAGYNFNEGSGTNLVSLPTANNGSFFNTPTWLNVYSFSWTKTGDVSFSASTKDLTNISTGDYLLTVSNGYCFKSRNFSVLSNDNTPPVASCVSSLSVDVDVNGEATVSPAMIDDGSTDNCGIASMSVSPEILSCSNNLANTAGIYKVSATSNDGNTTVTVTFTNIKLNLSQQYSSSYNAYFTFDYNIDVVGTPVNSYYTKQLHFYLINGQDQSADLIGVSGSANSSIFGLSGTYSSDIAVEDVTTSLNLLLGFQTLTYSEFSNTSIELSPSEEQLVTLTVVDNAGNTSTCQTLVSLNDALAPVPDQIMLADVTAECEVTSLIAPTATDNCSGEITGTTSTTLPITTQGTTIITWTFSDGNGNTSTQTQNVVIDDDTKPGITCPATITETVDAGMCTASGISLGTPVTTDNCGVASVANNASEPYSLGTTTVTWTVTDIAGNIATCNQNITIVPEEAIDISIEDLGNSCQGGETGSTTTILWNVTKITGSNNWVFDYEITEGATIVASGSNIAASGNTQVSFEAVNETAQSKTFLITVKNVQDACGVEEINTLNNSDSITLDGVPNTSDINTN